jgi:hypothetical protein
MRITHGVLMLLKDCVDETLFGGRVGLGLVSASSDLIDALVDRSITQVLQKFGG